MGTSASDARARFEQLFRAHYRPILAYARRRAAADVADDVAAETFLVAWRRLDDVPREPFPWLIGVARHALANQERASRRQRALTSKARSAEPTLETTDRVDRDVLAALARLPEGEREAVTLTSWEGLTAKEAAAVLGCSAVAVRVRVHRARRRLAEQLDREPRRAAEAAAIKIREEHS